MTLQGLNFLDGIHVKIGTQPCDIRSINLKSCPQRITCQTRAQNAGKVPVILTNPDTQSTSIANGFSFISGLSAPTQVANFFYYPNNPIQLTLGSTLPSGLYTPLPNPHFSPVPTPSSNPTIIDLTNFTTSPILPNGLQINYASGEISGTPTETSPTQLYTIYTSSSSYQLTAQIFLGVSNFGTGLNQNLLVSSSNQIVNTYSAILSSTISSGSISFKIQDPATGASSSFTPGDEILLIQMQNSAFDFASSNWEFAKILTVTPLSPGVVTITTVSPILNYYSSLSSSLSSLSTSASVSQIIKIPQYQSIQVPLGQSITAVPWNGSIGGVLAFRSTGSVQIDGAIHTNGKGFRGGIGQSLANFGSTPLPSTQPGESWNGTGSSETLTTGGGAGGAIIPGSSSGGSAAYGSNGALPPSPIPGYFPSASGTLYGNSNLNLLFLGSGGGGSVQTTGCAAPSGGAGGGIILIYAKNVKVNGLLSSNGDHAKLDPGGCLGDVGGPGAGGSILLSSFILDLGINRVTAQGGRGDWNYTGNGGSGRIRLNSPTIIGTTLPNAGFVSQP